MNALKHKVAETKAERERVKQRRASVNESVEFFKYASGLVLHDKFGFGKKRLSLFYKDLTALFDDYTDRYESKYLLDGMKKQCKDRGIEFEG